jgi:hypothetical protein
MRGIQLWGVGILAFIAYWAIGRSRDFFSGRAMIRNNWRKTLFEYDRKIDPVPFWLVSTGNLVLIVGATYIGFSLVMA